MAGSLKQFWELKVGFLLSAVFICSPVASQVCGVAQGVSQAGLTSTATTATLQWVYNTNFPANCVQQVAVCWTSNELTPTTACQSLPSSATSIVMTGLQPCTTYSIRVTVKPATGASATSTFNTVTGAAGAENMTVSWVSPSSLRVSWQYLPQRLTCVTRFLAAVCDTSNQALANCLRFPMPTDFFTNDYYFDVTNLQSCRFYHVRVVTELSLLNAAAIQSPETSFFLSGVSLAGFNVTETGPSYMRVGWTAPQVVDATCSNYTLTACAVPRVVEGRTRCVTNLTAGVTTQVNITNLRPCTPYQLRVNLSNPGGDSVTLGPVLPTFSTDLRLVTSLQLTRSRNQIRARWVPVHADPLCAKGYRICWNDTTGLECEVTPTNTTSFTILELESGSYVVEVTGIFFDDSLSTPVTQTARISGASRMFISPVILMLAVACGKVIQIT